MNEHIQISLRLSRIMMNQEVQGKTSLLQDKQTVFVSFLSVSKQFGLFIYLAELKKGTFEPHIRTIPYIGSYRHPIPGTRKDSLVAHFKKGVSLPNQ